MESIQLKRRNSFDNNPIGSYRFPDVFALENVPDLRFHSIYQWLLQTVGTHLVTQDATALHSDEDPDYSGCAYRGEEGTSCAVGCLIPENVYDGEFEATAGGRDLFNNYPELLTQILDECPAEQRGPHFDDFNPRTYDQHEHTMVEFLVLLQNLHDNVDPVDWRVGLNHLAGQMNLKITLPT